MRRLFFLFGCAVLLLCAAAGTAPAAGATRAAAPRPPLPPPGSDLVMNMSLNYVNWEDNGNVGYWALNEARQKVKVWQVAPGSFYLVAWYRGTWTTYAGVPSPNCSTEPGDSFGLPVAQADGSGPWSGWVAFSFDATAHTPTFGYLDTFDDGGTMADVMLGYYYVPGTDTPLQVGSRHDADSALFDYFTIDDWDSLVASGAYYVYRYKSQRMVWSWSPEAGDSMTRNTVVTR
jgi:hypothetical protein